MRMLFTTFVCIFAVYLMKFFYDENTIYLYYIILHVSFFM